MDAVRPLLRAVVAVVAIVAPLVHSATDAIELAAGYSTAQLWLNYVAFVPMAWLLVGLCAASDADLGAIGLAGAILYGAAFTYFAHSTLVALEQHVATYDALWRQLGPAYTLHGAAMVGGGSMFAWAAWRTRAFPRPVVALFALGLAVNLSLAVLPAPAIAQTLGTALRNAGLVGIGCAMLLGMRSRSGR